MALFRCNQCNHIREVANTYIGKSVKCPQCKTAAPIYDTVLFVENILKKYIVQHKEINRLRQNNKEDKKQEIENSNEYVELLDIHNTTALTREKQYESIIDWFQHKDIELDVNHNAVDTTGFFDEIALSLGNQYDVLKEVNNQIKYIQKKGYTNVKLTLSKKSKEDKTVIKNFCKELYDYSFVTKYYFKKQDQVIYLTLQQAPDIINFFNGLWMEWFVLIKLLVFFKENKIPNSCLRSLNVTFPNNDKNELDIFFIANDIPVCIECKSGEFRAQIDKYSKLRKRLKIDKSQFILCVIGLDNKQTQGLSGTYDITFVNETNFIQHIEKLLIK
jgi:phage FluMu protein Com